MSKCTIDAKANWYAQRSVLNGNKNRSRPFKKRNVVSIKRG